MAEKGETENEVIPITLIFIIVGANTLHVGLTIYTISDIILNIDDNLFRILEFLIPVFIILFFLFYLTIPKILEKLSPTKSEKIKIELEIDKKYQEINERIERIKNDNELEKMKKEEFIKIINKEYREFILSKDPSEKWIKRGFIFFCLTLLYIPVMILFSSLEILLIHQFLLLLTINFLSYGGYYSLK